MEVISPIFFTLLLPSVLSFALGLKLKMPNLRLKANRIVESEIENRRGRKRCRDGESGQSKEEKSQTLTEKAKVRVGSSSWIDQIEKFSTRYPKSPIVQVKILDPIKHVKPTQMYRLSWVGRIDKSI